MSGTNIAATLAMLSGQLAELAAEVRRQEASRRAARLARRKKTNEATESPTVQETPPGRLGEVLNALLDGLSEKQIALLLGLSRHTIHVYVKSLHKLYNVGARSELLSLWIPRHRDGFARSELPAPARLAGAQPTSTRRPLRRSRSPFGP